MERLPEPKLPKCRRRKRGPASLAGEEVEEDIEEEDVDGDVTEDRSRARVLWIRNLTRIQRQVGCGVQFVCAVNCVERSLYECTLFSLTPLPSPSFPFLPPSSPSILPSPQIRVVRAFQASVRESSNVYLSAVQDFTKTPYAIQRKTGEDGQTTEADVQGTSV